MAGRFTVEAIFKAVDRVTTPVNRMQNRIGKFTRSMERGLTKANRALDKVVNGLRAGARAGLKFAGIGLAAVTAGVGLLIREFSKIENAEAAFTPLLGGAKRAKELIAELNETAASTPFQFETLAGAASQLLPVMNGDIKGTINLIRMLGDTAGGNAQKLESITRGFTKAMLKGKVDMESLNMIAEAGVPIFNDLADVIGVKMGPAFFKMVSAGKVSTGQLTKAFERMTTSGGIFFMGMEIASKTTTGLFSTLKDNISLTAAEIGGVLAPTVKDLIKSSTEIAKRVRTWVTQNRELIRTRFLDFVDAIRTGINKLIEVFKKLNEEQDVFQRLKTVLSAVVDLVIFLSRHGETIAKFVAGVIALSLALKVLSVALAIVSVAGAPISLVIPAIAAAIALLITFREPIADFFKKLGLGVWVAQQMISDAWDSIKGIMGNIADAFKFIANAPGRLFDAAIKIAAGEQLVGLSSETGGPRINTVGPSEKIARTLEETRNSSSAEVTIRDDTGRAQVTSGSLGNGITLQPSGGF